MFAGYAGLFTALGIVCVVAAYFIAYVTYGYSSAEIQRVHHTFAPGIVGFGLLSLFCGMLLSAFSGPRS